MFALEESKRRFRRRLAYQNLQKDIYRIYNEYTQRLSLQEHHDFHHSNPFPVSIHPQGTILYDRDNYRFWVQRINSLKLFIQGRRTQHYENPTHLTPEPQYDPFDATQYESPHFLATHDSSITDQSDLNSNPVDTDEQDNADELHNTMEYTTFIHYNAQGQRCPVNTTSYYKPNYVPLLPNPSSQPCLAPGGKHGMRSIAYRNKRKRIKQELQMSRNTIPSDTNSSLDIQKSDPISVYPIHSPILLLLLQRILRYHSLSAPAIPLILSRL